MFNLTSLIDRQALNSFCQKNHVSKLSVFGSAIRDQLTPDSDIDILIEFKKKHTPGLFDLAGMEMELSEKIGRKVDLRTSAELSRYFRDEVISLAQIEYDA